jgi:hypothetical protein
MFETWAGLHEDIFIGSRRQQQKSLKHLESLVHDKLSVLAWPGAFVERGIVLEAGLVWFWVAGLILVTLVGPVSLTFVLFLLILHFGVS